MALAVAIKRAIEPERSEPRAIMPPPFRCGRCRSPGSARRARPKSNIDGKGIRSLPRPDTEKNKRSRLKNAVPGPDGTQLAATPVQDLRKARKIATISLPVRGSSGEFRYKSIALRISHLSRAQDFRSRYLRQDRWTRERAYVSHNPRRKML
jgi:hypothetical protein